jgi:hypothetical protein
MPADVAVRALQSIMKRERSICGILAEVTVDGSSASCLARSRGTTVWSSPTEAGFAHPDSLAQALCKSDVVFLSFDRASCDRTPFTRIDTRTSAAVAVRRPGMHRTVRVGAIQSGVFGVPLVESGGTGGPRRTSGV